MIFQPANFQMDADGGIQLVVPSNPADRRVIASVSASSVRQMLDDITHGDEPDSDQLLDLVYELSNTFADLVLADRPPMERPLLALVSPGAPLTPFDTQFTLASF